MSRSTTEREGVRLQVEGRVQGVGFRWWTSEQAAVLGITGTVRNLPDGSVEITAFGPPAALTALRRAVHDGPPSALVERVSGQPIEAEDAPKDFRIEP